MRQLAFVLLFLISLPILSQNEGIVGARAYSMGGISILSEDVWAVSNNPAQLAKLTNWTAGISYENQFLQTELATKTAAIAMPISPGSFGLSVHQFGFNGYNENRIGISYGQSLGKNLSMGLQLNYLNTSIGEGYGSTSSISGNVGVLAQLSDELQLAAMIINPNRAKLAEFSDERYPTILKIGLGYAFSEKVRLLSEVAKDIDFDANVRVGLEYQAMDMIYLRVGYGSQPALSTFGFGLLIDRFVVDFSSSFDSNLGFSPQLSISYVPNKTSN